MSQKIKITTELEVFETVSQLAQPVQSLMQEAIIARDTAYAPYSKFHVGAAILLDNGVVVRGSNQENASYPSGLCAERTAVYYAGAQYPQAIIKTIAITAQSQLQETTTPVPPCGACRQALAEYELKQKQPIELYFMGEKGKVFKSTSLENLLPLLFTANYL